MWFSKPTLGKHCILYTHRPLLATTRQWNSNYGSIIRAPSRNLNNVVQMFSLLLYPLERLSHQCVRTHCRGCRKQPRHNRNEGRSCKHPTHQHETSRINAEWTFQRCVFQCSCWGGKAASRWRNAGLGLTTSVALSCRILTLSHLLLSSQFH